ncbi:MAG: RyR domain-containing protein [Vicinamibacteria bacterium]
MQEVSSQPSPFAGRGRLSWALRRFWRARLRPLWRDARAPIVITLGLTVVVFGTIGYSKEGDEWWEALVKSFQLYAFGSAPESGDPVVLNIARVLGPLLVGVAAIRGLLVLSREQLRLIGFRLFRRNHIVVAGLGDVGFGLAARLNELGARVIAIDRDATKPAIEGCKERGISVLVGDAADADLLRAACVHRARHLIVAPGADGVAIDVVAAAIEITSARAADPLRVIAHIEDRALWQALQARTLTEGDDPDVQVELFNLYEAAGRLVLDTYPPFADAAAAGHRGPAVLIVADQAIAEVLVVNTARLWRNSRVHSRARIEITLAGDDTAAECERLRQRYPALDGIVELEPWEIDLASPALRESERSRDAVAIYVALGDEARGVATALTLAATNQPAGGVVLVINDERLGAATIASAEGRPGSIRLFAILKLVLSERFLVGGLRETLARAMHDSYERDQLAKGATEQVNVKPWDELDDDARSSNRDFAGDIPRKLAALGCVVVPAALADVERSTAVFDQRLTGRLEEFAEAEHERWMRERIGRGWSYGPERDDGAKRHPCLLAYDQLSDEDKDKDRVAVIALPEMLAKAGFAVEPVAGE